MPNPAWGEDGADGKPSSMDVLLQWLSISGNIDQWQEAAYVRDGTRVVLINDIYKLLLANGITYRTRGSIDAKIWGLLHSFEKAEHWLQRKGLYHFDSSSRAKRKVLKVCPYYPQLVSLLKRSRSAGAANSQTNRRMEVATEITVESEYSDDDDVELLNIGSKRTPDGVNGEVSKRVRVEQPLRGLENTEARTSEHSSLMEAEKYIRHELFKLELQAKRDEAICVRVKARRELLDLGVSFEEVDRLMLL